ncbi:hypothetical protein J1614_005072 [Plenodomus biglobosus]|nr:hypothetical protein J1614_005072 [Plenodomus biglobosus]
MQRTIESDCSSSARDKGTCPATLTNVKSPPALHINPSPPRNTPSAALSSGRLSQTAYPTPSSPHTRYSRYTALASYHGYHRSYRLVVGDR